MVIDQDEDEDEDENENENENSVIKGYAKRFAIKPRANNCLIFYKLSVCQKTTRTNYDPDATVWSHKFVKINDSRMVY